MDTIQSITIYQLRQSSLSPPPITVTITTITNRHHCWCHQLLDDRSEELVDDANFKHGLILKMKQCPEKYAHFSRSSSFPFAVPCSRRDRESFFSGGKIFCHPGICMWRRHFLRTGSRSSWLIVINLLTSSIYSWTEPYDCRSRSSKCPSMEHILFQPMKGAFHTNFLDHILWFSHENWSKESCLLLVVCRKEVRRKGAFKPGNKS